MQCVVGEPAQGNLLMDKHMLYIPNKVQPVSNDVKQMPCDIGEAKTTRHVRDVRGRQRH